MPGRAGTNTGAGFGANSLPPDLAVPPSVHNRQISLFTETNRPGFRLDERDGNGIAWWPDENFSDGTIELDLRGKDVPQKSFVGIAFHGLNQNVYEAIYFRPFNFHAIDPAARSHAVQYVALPAYDWQKLRGNYPGQFEKPVIAAPAADQWFHARIVITHPRITVFINGAVEPCLAVDQLSDRTGGWIGFWAGNGSGGDFANLKITAAKPSLAGSLPK